MKYALLLGVVACLIACTDKSNDGELSKPNIILIMTDDQGYGDYSCHGNPWLQTPHLDQLSKESVNFSNFHVATTCSPTRAGLLTGMHCNRTGTWHTVNGRSFLATRFPTIATYLKEVGYETSIFGKWHLGDNYPFRPQDRGFEEVLIHLGGGVGQGPDYWGNDYFDDTYVHNGEEKKYDGYCADIWFGEAVEYIKGRQNSNKPFFCYISSNTAHSPHYAPAEYIEPFLDNDEVVNPGFYGQVSNIDDNVGRLMASLDELGLDENTIILFTNDNGTAGGAALGEGGHVVKGFNAAMRGKKASEYEGGHRVALFAKFPSAMDIQLNTYQDLTNYTDIVPTLLDIAGHKQNPESGFDGESILPLIQNGSQESLKERVVIVDTQRSELPVKWKRSCVMKDQWRLINQAELYNLTFDPGQQDNIIEHHPDLAESMRGAYEEWWSDQEADHLIDNRIIVGHELENPSLLMSHDWHAEATPPWHQAHVRSAQVSNGPWSLYVDETGEYEIRLYRWHPALNKKPSEELPAYDDWKVGKALSLVSGKISCNGEEVESSELTDGTHYFFKTTLDKGDLDFQTWMVDDSGAERGAYYVEFKKV